MPNTELRFVSPIWKACVYSYTYQIAPGAKGVVLAVVYGSAHAGSGTIPTRCRGLAARSPQGDTLPFVTGTAESYSGKKSTTMSLESDLVSMNASQGI